MCILRNRFKKATNWCRDSLESLQDQLQPLAKKLEDTQWDGQSSQRAYTGVIVKAQARHSLMLITIITILWSTHGDWSKSA